MEEWQHFIALTSTNLAIDWWHPNNSPTIKPIYNFKIKLVPGTIQWCGCQGTLSLPRIKEVSLQDKIIDNTISFTKSLSHQAMLIPMPTRHDKQMFAKLSGQLMVMSVTYFY